MRRSNTKVIADLNGLVSVCKDGEEGYRSAEADVATSELKGLFNGYARQREEFAAELLGAIHRLDTPAERKGQRFAPLHRSWMWVKGALTRWDLGPIVNECERGEHVALKRYEAALKRPLPPEVMALVEKQYTQIRAAHDRIDAMKLIRVLNGLIAHCRDAARGYAAARRCVRQQELRETFARYAEQRDQFANQLQAEVRRLADVAETGGTFLGLLHRGWIRLKGVVRHGIAPSFIRECLRGERCALKRYEAALKKPMPVEVQALLQRQQALIEDARNHLAGLVG